MTILLATGSELGHETFKLMNVLEGWLASAEWGMCDHDGSDHLKAEDSRSNINLRAPIG